jgi:hypothetical protein
MKNEKLRFFVRFPGLPAAWPSLSWRRRHFVFLFEIDSVSAPPRPEFRALSHEPLPLGCAKIRVGAHLVQRALTWWHASCLTRARDHALRFWTIVKGMRVQVDEQCVSCDEDRKDRGEMYRGICR